MNRYRVICAGVLVSLTALACWRDDHPVPVDRRAAREASPAEPGLAMQPVDFRVLRELLPSTFDGLPRQRVGGETSGALGVKVSRATAEYYAEDVAASAASPLAVVTITDLAGLEGRSLLSIAAWLMADIDRETESGYERTMTYRGHPAYEKYSNLRAPTSRFEVLVRERYVVEIMGDAMEMENLKAELDQFDLQRLERLANAEHPRDERGDDGPRP